MKANTVVVISGKVCAPTKPVPEHPMMDLGEAESHPGLVYKIEMFDYERDLKDFLSSCVPFEDQMRGLVKLGLAHDIPDGIPKENHPYTVPDYEFEVKSVEIMNGAVFSHFVAVLVDEKKVEPTPPKDLQKTASTVSKRRGKLLSSAEMRIMTNGRMRISSGLITHFQPAK